MCSVKSGRSSACARCRAVEMASEPTSSTACSRPAAISPANSVTRCCGACPPTTSSTARGGLAPIRPATERGKLSDRPSGATARGPEISNWRTDAIVVSAAATVAGSAPVSARACAAAAAASSTGDIRLYPGSSMRSDAWPTPTRTGVVGSMSGSAMADLPERQLAVHFDLLGQPEDPFGDDVALDLVGAPADRGEVGVEGQEVRLVADRLARPLEHRGRPGDPGAHPGLLVQQPRHRQLAQRHHRRRRTLLQL